MSMIGALDLRHKVTAIELGWISAQDDGVGIEYENILHPLPIVARHLIPRIAQHRDDLFPESIVRLDHQHSLSLRFHNTYLLRWPQTFPGFNLARDCRPSPVNIIRSARVALSVCEVQGTAWRRPQARRLVYSAITRQRTAGYFPRF